MDENSEALPDFADEMCAEDKHICQSMMATYILYDDEVPVRKVSTGGDGSPPPRRAGLHCRVGWAWD